jgi:hypothetical protein
MREWVMAKIALEPLEVGWYRLKRKAPCVWVRKSCHKRKQAKICAYVEHRMSLLRESEPRPN